MIFIHILLKKKKKKNELLFRTVSVKSLVQNREMCLSP